MTDQQEQRYRFSEAPIWELQRAYYEEEGLRAWNNDQTPQYITSNPLIGAAYAEMIFGFLQDRARMGYIRDTVHVVELGAGAGRFAFHALQELCALIEYAGVPLPPFRYVMTDLAMSNVKVWREHPALEPFVARGLLDFARFDAVADETLELVVSGTVIRQGELRQPIVLVANYFFDGIPQELLYIGDGNVYETDVFVAEPERADGLKPSELIKRVSLRYEHRRAPEYEQETYPYRGLISVYREELEDSHVLFPAVGLTCLERLNALSQHGLVLLTADKGDHLLDNWKFADPPELIFHGSFSLTANYHALLLELERRGALALFPPQHYKNLNVGCILRVDSPRDYAQTRLAYRRFIERFGPDEFFSLKTWVDPHAEEMGLQQLLAFWRLGGYDAEFFLHVTKRMAELIPDASDEEKLDLAAGIGRMWDSYYAMAQRFGVSLESGVLLFQMDRYEEAKRFLEISIEEEPDGVVSTVYYCLAICCFELDKQEEGLAYTRQLLLLEPDNEEARALLEGF